MIAEKIFWRWYTDRQEKRTDTATWGEFFISHMVNYKHRLFNKTWQIDKKSKIIMRSSIKINYTHYWWCTKAHIFPKVK